MRSFLTAVQFLTRVPVPGGDRPVTPADLQRAAVYFPWVGTLVGLFTASVVFGARFVWAPWLAALVALALEALLTGAFHEDAVADFFDAFGGGWSREDVLRILKDSRLGSYGALALGLGVLLRAGALATLPSALLVASVAASAALGRWMILVLMARLPPITDRPSLSRDIGRQIGPWQVIVGGLWALPATATFAWLAPWRLAIAAMMLVVLAVIFETYLRRRLGGVTGDCLGCFCYLSQILVLLAACLELPIAG